MYFCYIEFYYIYFLIFYIYMYYYFSYLYTFIPKRPGKVNYHLLKKIFKFINFKVKRSFILILLKLRLNYFIK